MAGYLLNQEFNYNDQLCHLSERDDEKERRVAKPLDGFQEWRLAHIAILPE